MNKSRVSAEKVEAAIASLPPEPQIHDVDYVCTAYNVNLYHIINVAKLGHLLPESELYKLKNY
jgi:hypothetical protein